MQKPDITNRTSLILGNRIGVSLELKVIENIVACPHNYCIIAGIGQQNLVSCPHNFCIISSFNRRIDV